MPVVGFAATAGGLTAITVLGATVTTVSSVALAATIAIAANLAIGIALSFATSQALGKPKPPSVSSLGDGRSRSVMVREPLTAWWIIYGRVRQSGPLTFIHTSDSVDAQDEENEPKEVRRATPFMSLQEATAFLPANILHGPAPTGEQVLHLLITLSGHELEAIEDVYFDDDVVPIDGNGYTQGRWTEVVEPGSGSFLIPQARAIKGLGTTPGDATLQSLLQETGIWTVDHRQQGRGKLYVRLVFNEDVFPSGVPQISCIVKGRRVFDPRTSTTTWSDNPALCLRDYLTAPAFGVGATAEEIDDEAVIAAANVCDELVALV
ncbi:MAG: hypothetical protein ACREKH_14910, partial [Candidatus Rokuibacteriota bacterium]